MALFSWTLYRIPNEVVVFYFSWLEAFKIGKSMKNDCSDLVENVLVFSWSHLNSGLEEKPILIITVEMS